LSYTEIISERYLNMTNEQLLLLYENEIAELTPEARSLLIKELKKREIYPNDIYSINETTSTVNFSIEQLPNEIVFFIIDCLEKGCDVGYLTGGLIERGVTEDEVNWIIKSLPTYLEILLKKNAESLLKGIFTTTAALALQSLPLNRENQQSLIILSYLLLFWGILSVFHRVLKKRRLKRAINTAMKLR
jgi:hypothetical protein